MRFWTIQPRVVWAQMEQGDSVRVDPDNPRYGGRRPWQYKWLAAGLQRSRPGFDGGWPWWLTSVKPELRRQRSLVLPGGPSQTCIELELPSDRYLSFPLWMWETVYTGHYLAATHEELAEWFDDLPAGLAESATRPLPEPWQSRLELSWQRIFDDNWHPRFWYQDEPIADTDSSLNQLMLHASAEWVGITQELRGADTVRFTNFDALEAPSPN